MQRNYTSFRFSVFTCTPSIITVNPGTGAPRHGGEGALLSLLSEVIEEEFGVKGYVANTTLFIPNSVTNQKRISELSTVFALHENKYPVTIDNKEFTIELKRY